MFVFLVQFVGLQVFVVFYAELICFTLDAPENLAISGILNTCIHEPTEVICSASGYPPPTFKWLNLSSGNVLSQNSTVTIGSAGSYQCFASNTFRNVQHNASQVLDVADCSKCYLYLLKFQI